MLREAELCPDRDMWTVVPLCLDLVIPMEMSILFTVTSQQLAWSLAYSGNSVSVCEKTNLKKAQGLSEWLKW